MSPSTSTTVVSVQSLEVEADLENSACILLEVVVHRKLGPIFSIRKKYKSFPAVYKEGWHISPFPCTVQGKKVQLRLRITPPGSIEQKGDLVDLPEATLGALHRLTLPVQLNGQLHEAKVSLMFKAATSHAPEGGASVLMEEQQPACDDCKPQAPATPEQPAPMPPCAAHQHSIPQKRSWSARIFGSFLSRSRSSADPRHADGLKDVSMLASRQNAPAATRHSFSLTRPSGSGNSVATSDSGAPSHRPSSDASDPSPMHKRPRTSSGFFSWWYGRGSNRTSIAPMPATEHAPSQQQHEGEGEKSKVLSPAPASSTDDESMAFEEGGPSLIYPTRSFHKPSFLVVPEPHGLDDPVTCDSTAGALKADIMAVLGRLQAVEEAAAATEGILDNDEADEVILSPRKRLEYRRQLEHMLASPNGEESVARAMLNSLAMELEPFDKGTPVQLSGAGEGWYHKPVRRAPRGCSGKVSSGESMTEQQQQQQGGSACAMQDTPHGQTAAEEAPLVLARARYAAFDQMGANGESACSCISLEVAAWLERHPGAVPDTAVLSKLVSRGASIWRSLCTNPKLQVPGDKCLDLPLVLEHQETAQGQHLYEQEEAYCFIGPAGVQDRATTFTDFVAYASAAAERGGCSVYIVTCHSHSVVIAFQPDGRTHLINSLGRQLDHSCRLAYVLEFDSADDMCAVYVAQNTPSGPATEPVSAHKVGVKRPPGGRAEFKFFAAKD
mmetsp:Transcript_3949/g.8519  ORF Transcript_3949/g.8519 Transcript_3949/m.8519 type:complete len:725 (-) Transcript_3949:1146-3320(-)